MNAFRIRLSDTSAAMLPGMNPQTPSASPVPPVIPDPPSRGATTPPGDALGPTLADLIDRDRLRETIGKADGSVWWLARCIRCGDDPADPLTEPFRSEAERDEWAALHVSGSGHAVTLTIDGPPALMTALHMIGVLSRDPAGQLRFVCPADDCGTSNGPYDTPETAIASWRQHKPSRRGARS